MKAHKDATQKRGDKAEAGGLVSRKKEAFGRAIPREGGKPTGETPQPEAAIILSGREGGRPEAQWFVTAGERGCGAYKFTFVWGAEGGKKIGRLDFEGRPLKGGQKGRKKRRGRERGLNIELMHRENKKKGNL